MTRFIKQYPRKTGTNPPGIGSLLSSAWTPGRRDTNFHLSTWPQWRTAEPPEESRARNKHARLRFADLAHLQKCIIARLASSCGAWQSVSLDLACARLRSGELCFLPRHAGATSGHTLAWASRARMRPHTHTLIIIVRALASKIAALSL